MKELFHETLKALRHPVKTRRRGALMALEREWDAEEIARLCSQLRDLNPAAAVEICDVLADATAAPLIELLADFALKDDVLLQGRALRALESIPGPLRANGAKRLLASAAEDVREKACELLGSSGLSAPSQELAQRLEDPSPKVVLAALEAMRLLDAAESADQVAAVLKHPDEAVRVRAIEALVDIAAPKEFPAGRAVEILRSGDSTGVRVAAAWALGMRPKPNSQQALLDALGSDDDLEVRCAAATALGSYEDPEVARILLRISAQSSQMAISLNCRKAVNHMREDLVLAACREMMEEDDPVIRLETVMTLGELSLEGAADELLARIDTEWHPVVRAAIVEALGVSGRAASWDKVRACVNDSMLVAYAAVAALGALLDGERLEDYLAMMDELGSNTLREAALSRLNLYGRARGLPPSASPVIVPLIASRNASVAYLAADAAGLIGEATVAMDLLASLRERREEDFTEIVAESIARVCQGQAFPLIEVTGDKYLPELASVIRRTRDLGRGAREVCRRLAGYCAQGASGSREALAAAGEANPEALVSVMAELPAEPAKAAAEVWVSLPEDQRERAPMNWTAMLRSPAPGVRRVALEAMDRDAGLGLLPLLVDMAISDPGPDVRDAARLATRRAVGA